AGVGGLLELVGELVQAIGLRARRLVGVGLQLARDVAEDLLGLRRVALLEALELAQELRRAGERGAAAAAGFAAARRLGARRAGGRRRLDRRCARHRADSADGHVAFLSRAESAAVWATEGKG